MNYFVLTSDGQKYGPADIALLNQWIAEGRIQPTAMLQEEGTNLQVRASTVPALKFGPNNPSLGGAPPVAPPSANPYDTPRPMASYQPPNFQSNYPRGGYVDHSSAVNKQIAVGWACTLGAPVLIWFTWFGLFLIIPGFRAAAALYSQGKTGHAIGMFIINGLNSLLWIGVRVAFVNRVNSGY